MPLFAHQKASIKRIKPSSPLLFDWSDPGCVSADTEFLTPWGWKRIDQYQEGEAVAQFHPDIKEIEWVIPKQYIKIPCSEMVWINPVRGTSQRLSPEHRTLLYKPDGSWVVRSAYEYMSLLHQKTSSHYCEKFCATFRVKNRAGLLFSDKAIRVMVAVIADGHFPYEGAKCVIRVKKTRKILRLRKLLESAEINYVENTCGGNPEFQVFRFKAPWQEKEFGKAWFDASQEQLEIIADELPHWDSSISTRPSKGIRFSSLKKQSADFAQYAFSATGLNTSLGENTHAERHIEYVVHASRMTAYVGGGRKTSVYLGPNEEGFKYCFEVPSSFLLLRHNGYIFATGNTGKTRVQIEAFADRRRKGGGRAIVVAPKSLLTAAWQQDFLKFAPDISVVCAYATNRTEALNSKADVIVTNHDAVKELGKLKPNFWKGFDTLVVDESTAFKHYTSQRSKALAKLAKNFTYRSLMTGTPMSNGILDIWHQTFILDGGQRLGKSYFSFRNAACYSEQVGPSSQMVKWHDKPGVDLIVSDMLKDVVIRHQFDDCVDIPENHRYAISYKPSKKHQATYDDMQDYHFLQLAKTGVTAINGGVVYTKLLQIASGAVYNDAGEYSLIDTGRYEMIMDLVDAREHSIVFFNWEHQRDELVKEAESRGFTYTIFDGGTSDRDRASIVSAYQKGEYKVLLAHPQSAGHGLTLTRGTATIWASPTYNLEHFLQGLKRIHRIGQTVRTETIVVIAEGTIDEKVWLVLKDKDAKQGNMLKLLKEEVAA
jgi:hypothetical protein